MIDSNFDIVMLLFTVYSILISVLYFRDRRGEVDAGVNKLETVLADFDPTSEKRLELMLELEKLKITQIPWYMKSISSIGAIAFLSMIAATSVQTISASIEAQKVDRLEALIERSTQQEEQANRAIAAVTSVVMDIHALTGRVPNSSEVALRHRLQFLRENKQSPTEAYSLAMLLRDFDTALEIAAENESVLKSSGASSQLTLAQYYFILGLERDTRAITSRLWEQRPELSTYWKLQIVVLSYLTDPGRDSGIDQYVTEISVIIDKPFSEARHLLLSEAQTLLGARDSVFKKTVN